MPFFVQSSAPTESWSSHINSLILQYLFSVVFTITVLFICYKTYLAIEYIDNVEVKVIFICISMEDVWKCFRNVENFDREDQFGE